MSVALLAALLLALAQDAQAQDEPALLPEVTVSGARSTVQEARRFVEEISTAPLHSLSLATWMTPICIGTVNLSPELILTLTSQIEARAREAGVTVQPAGCSPNITLLGTSDGRFTATELVDEFHGRFMASDGPTQGDERALRRFAEAEVPVRWWAISALMDERSHVILVPIWGAPARQINTTGDMYFGQNRREGLLTSLVILDLSRTQGVSGEVLGDYLAMVVLANIDPGARAGGYPTILNLWDGGETSAGLTPWDRAYLKALYEAPVRLSGTTLQLRSLYQRTEMARIMARLLSVNEAAP